MTSLSLIVLYDAHMGRTTAVCVPDHKLREQDVRLLKGLVARSSALGLSELKQKMRGAWGARKISTAEGLIDAPPCHSVYFIVDDHPPEPLVSMSTDCEYHGPLDLSGCSHGDDEFFGLR